MIIIKLIGGLGNQMFQYALGRALSLQNKDDFKLDISGFEVYKLHKYSLNHLNIIENIAQNSDIIPFRKYQKRTHKWWHIFNHTAVNHEKYVTDEQFSFQTRILSLKGSSYFDGYWQTEKYFKKYEDIIRKDFSFKEKLVGKDAEFAQKISQSNSVSVHIRRTDYVSNQRTSLFFGNFGPEYYKVAEKILLEKISNPEYFVFSDDHDWVKKNIRFNATTHYVDHNDASRNYKDLELMSLCKHNIIPNSSFAWWGAWLNTNPDKIVIAPKHWFADTKVNTEDLIPHSWIKI